MNSEVQAVPLVLRGPGWWECPLRADGLYGFAYWEEYAKRDRSPMGHALTAARVALLVKHCQGPVVDVGIGGGAFLVAARDAGLECYGADVNEHALGWLRRRGELWQQQPVEAMTFWDSLEHMDLPEIEAYLVKTQWAFISTPVYIDEADIRASRHFKPMEHTQYVSEAGLSIFMSARGFSLIESNTMESDLGRHGIATHVYRRTA